MMRRARQLGPVFSCVVVMAAIALVACEHAKYWRDGEPLSEKDLERLSDPAEAKRELAAHMAPAAPHDAPSPDWVSRQSAGCVTCHGSTDKADMHPGRTLAIGCVDCHGGNPAIQSPSTQPGRPGLPGTPITDSVYLARMREAHVQPRNPEAWYGNDDLADGRPFGQHGEKDPTTLHGSRTPPITFALLNHESPEFIRFINPGDLRVAAFACGACHPKQVAKADHSLMAHGSMLWAAALYNNGAVPHKLGRYGESYSPFGIPQQIDGVVTDAKWNPDTKQIDATVRPPTQAEFWRHGVLPFLQPLQTWNISQPGNILRVFERGNKLPVPGGKTPNDNPAEIGLPNPLAENGKPDKGLSVRGLGTANRTDPVFLGLQKSRLLDPLLSFMGTNDHAGDYRSSGCSACHVVYANDRDPAHSGAKYAAFGNAGHSGTVDPTIPHDEPGHPIQHVFTSAIPSSQCIVCHIHPGTSYANTYLGYMWWDNESDGEFMYPSRSRTPSDEQKWLALRHNPESSQLRGLWGNLYPDATSHAGSNAGPDFLSKIGEPRRDARDPLAKPHASSQPAPTLDNPSVFNDQLKHNQFADFHGHGWVFRAVYKKDRQGNLLTQDGAVIDPNDPNKWRMAVHLADIHLEKGMHCVDCHFEQDSHGDGKLYSEPRNAIEITCVDCHGTYDTYAADLKKNARGTSRTTIFTSGPAAPADGTNLMRTAAGVKRFDWDSDEHLLTQTSALDPKVKWTVPQTRDTVDPNSSWSKANGNADTARRSRYAHTIQTDGKTWGNPTDALDEKGCPRMAHSLATMECYTCHSSWMTSCFGCHLSMEANQRTPMLHNESITTRNFTKYNFQVLRDDVFMLGRDGSVRSGGVGKDGNLLPGKIVPVRSSSAVIVSSQNANREWIYHQQQTISGEGYSGQAFNPHFPHATSGVGTTKTCSDCHVSSRNDNNAWMAQLTLQGTNMMNFMGRYVYVADGKGGLEAVAVTEHADPQAVYGSHLHELAFPDEYANFVGRKNRALTESYHHDPLTPGLLGGEILDVQQRGEYLYAACGRDGFYAFDVANIDNKGFSERIVTAPVSPLGQRLGFKTKYAVCVASPTTLGVDPARVRLSSDPSKPRANIMDPPQPWHVNQEQAVHPMYAYLYIGDREEGLILTFAATLLDGDPTNNFMSRAKLNDGTTAFNPGGILNGLTSLVCAGHHLFATADAGLVVIDIDQPLSPKVIATIGRDQLRQPRSVAVQFRYAFVTDADGLKVVDVTEPTRPTLVAGAAVPLTDAHRVYAMRTYALVAAGTQGLAIIDVTNPERPQLQQLYTADGKLRDVRDVKAGMTNASLYGYVADAAGGGGLHVLQLMGPNTTPLFRGFAPPLAPIWLASARTHGPALAISKGLDRDRAVDETGHQLAVFARWGARPLNYDETRKLYMRDGSIWTVSDEPAGNPIDFVDTSKPAAPPPPPPSGPRRGPR